MCDRINENYFVPMYVHISEFGKFTDQNGHFRPIGDCLLASRYRVLEVVGSRSRGQSAVIVRAKVSTRLYSLHITCTGSTNIW